VHEALELRDGGRKYGGKGVSKAVKNVNTKIANALRGTDASDQQGIDSLLCRLDGTKNKSRLGANATTAVSLACAQCAASEQGAGLYRLLGKKPIVPSPMLNVLNGGKHAGNGVSIQEFMVFPLHFPSFSEALRAGSEIYHSLRGIISKKYGSAATGVGDEGGFAPPCRSTGEALSLLEQAIGECGYGKKVLLAMDAAASSFYDAKSGRYSVDGKRLLPCELSDLYASLAKSYPIISLEDPFCEEAFSDFAALRRRLSGRVQLVADDLTVTNVGRLSQAIGCGSLSSLLLKVNQVGTLSEALSAAALCRKSGLGVVVSHRSGETEDASIADIAAGIGCGQIKSGAPCRAERTAKYNRLLQIEEELPSGSFARASGIVL
jgi:enolase